MFNRNQYDLSYIFKYSERFEDSKNNKNSLYSDKTVKVFDDEEKTCHENLMFESRFESGNLAMASKVSDTEYNLLLQQDTNSFGNTQWFFFKVSNMKSRTKYKFNILNYSKKYSLYQEGMQVCIYSQKNFEKNNEGWYRGGNKITYSQNKILKNPLKTYSTMSFEYIFNYSDDYVYFAYAIPYTYTDLLTLLDNYDKNSSITNILIRKPLCKTISGNIVYYLTITNPGTRDEILHKKAVILQARVHPGETVSSHAMHNILNFLTSSSTEAHFLRNRYIFKIIPMMNPDGVINGNYRCSLLGVDLNRRWKRPDMHMHPEIFYSKKLIESIHKKYTIALIGDLHGHSIKKNIFLYGCNYFDMPHRCKLFPYYLSKNSNFISFIDCRFSVHKSKEKTLRVTLFRELKIPNVFTIEISFCGGNFARYKNMQYTCKAIREFADEFCKGLMGLDDCLTVPKKLDGLMFDFGHNRGISVNSECSAVSYGSHSTIIKNTRSEKFSSIFTEFICNKDLLATGEIEDDGSDSDPSEDNAVEEQIIKEFKNKNKEKNKKLPVTSVSSKVLSKPKCKKCGKNNFPDHICVRNIGKKEINQIKSIKQIKHINIVTKIIRSKEEPQKKKVYYTQTPEAIYQPIGKVKSENPQAVESANYDIAQKINSTFVERANEKNYVGLGLVSKSPIAEGRGILFRERSYDKAFDKIQKSFTPLPGVHLIGIIEGITCNLVSGRSRPNQAKNYK